MTNLAKAAHAVRSNMSGTSPTESPRFRQPDFTTIWGTPQYPFDVRAGGCAIGPTRNSGFEAPEHIVARGRGLR